MKKGLLIAAVAGTAMASTASAQSITTFYGANNGGSFGGATYFDVSVLGTALTITGFDTNTAELVPFGWSVYTRDGGGMGQSLAGDWALVATGNGRGMGRDNPSPITLDATFTLNANTLYGMALVMGPEAGHDYTNGTGGNENFANGDIALRLGDGGNVPFTGSAFSPRVWNGTIYYEPVPAPASLALIGLGGLVATRRRR